VIEVTPGGLLYIDGKFRGKDRAAITNLAPGPHEISVLNDGYKPHTETVELAPGQEKSVKVELQRAP
jgi:hypothetical protein